MQTIQQITTTIKNVVDDVISEWGMMAIIVFLGLASFGLGRLSLLEEARPAIAIREAAVNTESRPIAIGGLVVASRSGSAYHFPWCPGAESIAERNKIWFKSEEAARAAGYSPAKNCKGLE